MSIAYGSRCPISRPVGGRWRRRADADGSGSCGRSLSSTHPERECRLATTQSSSPSRSSSWRVERAVGKHVHLGPVRRAALEPLVSPRMRRMPRRSSGETWLPKLAREWSVMPGTVATGQRGLGHPLDRVRLSEAIVGGGCHGCPRPDELRQAAIAAAWSSPRFSRSPADIGHAEHLVDLSWRTRGDSLASRPPRTR